MYIEYENQWHLHGRSNHLEVDHRSSLNCEGAWDVIGRGSNDIIIAVVDTACDFKCPAFSGNSKFYGVAYKRDRWQLTKSIDNLPEESLFFTNTHGTSVCALICADGPLGTRGVAPKCRLLPIVLPYIEDKVWMDDNDILSILDLVSEHADVVLMSWSRVPVLAFSERVHEKFAEVASFGGRRKMGVPIVFPAGNSSSPLNGSFKKPHSYGLVRSGNKEVLLKSRKFRNTLSEIEGILFIGAISSLAQRSQYSNYGEGLDFCAPAGNASALTGEKLDGQALGLTTTYGEAGEVTHAFKGTSGAAALVAGVAGLAFSYKRSLTNQELVRLLRLTASLDLDFDDINLNPIYDYSPISNNLMPKDLREGNQTWTTAFGYGKVDALELALKLKSIT